MAKFLLDQHVKKELADRLSAVGHDVKRTQDLGFEEIPDDRLLALAAEDQRILYTYNVVDFAPLAIRWYSDGKQHRGLLYSAQVKAALSFVWIVAALELYPQTDDWIDKTLHLPVAGEL
jgi:Protein of unknown function DUF82.